MKYKSRVLAYCAAGLILVSAAGLGLKKAYDSFHEPETIAPNYKTEAMRGDFEEPVVEVTVPAINGVPADFDGDGTSDIRAIFAYGGGKPIKIKVRDSAGNIVEFSEDGKIVE